MNKLILLVTLSFLANGALAYGIQGDSDSGFILKCKDGTTFNMGVKPPNHVKAAADCEDHGGIMAGYPKALPGKAQLRSPAKNPVSAPQRAPAQDYNAARSNKPSS